MIFQKLQGFKGKIAFIRDIDSLRQLHSAFVSDVQKHCLLTQSGAVAQEALDRIMERALDFKHVWQARKTSQVPEQVYAAIEVDFMKCCTFVSSLLETLNHRNTMPDLEILARAFKLLTRVEVIWQPRVLLPSER